MTETKVHIQPLIDCEVCEVERLDPRENDGVFMEISVCENHRPEPRGPQ